jgi:hypothetical protein
MIKEKEFKFKLVITSIEFPVKIQSELLYYCREGVLLIQYLILNFSLNLHIL